jgi:hypothetical protein
MTAQTIDLQQAFLTVPIQEELRVFLDRDISVNEIDNLLPGLGRPNVSGEYGAAWLFVQRSELNGAPVVDVGYSITLRKPEDLETLIEKLRASSHVKGIEVFEGPLKRALEEKQLAFTRHGGSNTFIAPIPAL